MSARGRRRAPRALLAVLAPPALLLAAELALRAGGRLSCLGAPAPEPGFDLYVVGESTALGEPYNRDGFSLAELVSRRLGGAVGGRPIRVVTLAKGGQSIYPQASALEEALRCRDRSRPGAALIYSGHNDEGGLRGPSFFMRWERFLPRSRLLEAALYRLEERVPALRARTLDTWAFHLRRAARACREAGVTPVLATPVSDPRADPGLQEPGVEPETLAPLASAPCAELPRLAASASGSVRPYLVWRRARCAEAAGRADEAEALYREARDVARSVSFGRATSAQLAALRALAAEEGAPLADVEAAFAGRRGLFLDGHHPSMEGYLLLADAYARAVGRTVPGPRDAEEAFAAFGCGPSCRAEALSQAGWWWLSVSVGHAAPGTRLAAARGRFLEALALDRGLYGARLGLALAQRPDLLVDRGALDRLGRLGVFYGRHGEFSPEERGELASLLGREP